MRIGGESAKLECAHPGLMKVGFEGKTRPMCRTGIAPAPGRDRGGKVFPGIPAVYVHSENGGSIVELGSLQGAFAGSSRMRILPVFDVIRPSQAGSMLLEAGPRETRRHQEG